MSEAVERPAWRISFRGLAGIVLGLSLVAVLAGRYVYLRYGGYRPLALAHVPQNMRYRARVELSDEKRVDALRPLLAALDRRQVRRAAIEQKLGFSAKKVVHEVAFGVGPDPLDFVLVFGLQLQAGSGLSPAKVLCEALASDGIRSEPSPDGGSGCRLQDGGVIAATEDGAVVVASKAELVKDLLRTPDIGDRLGFSGPSVRGVAPQIDELGRESSALAQQLSAKYP
jgi:hypothetical protein